MIASSNDASEPLVEVPASELDLLQYCKMIIDAANTMQCGKCNKTFATLDFYDHIFQNEDCCRGDSSILTSQASQNPQITVDKAAMMTENDCKP